MSGYTYITRQQQLDLAITQISKSKTIAVDTESSGFYTYQPELCLIQVSSEGFHFLVDVLAGLDLSGLKTLFADPGIVKIFHAASSDISEMGRDLGWQFRNIFDTMLACRMLGHESCSLAALVQMYQGLHLEKREQKSNWKQRPLTKSQLDYAHGDTLYLEEIRKKMEQELRDLGLYEELAEEFERITLEKPAEVRGIDPNAWSHVSGVLKLTPLQRGLFRNLFDIRENRARKSNIAPFRLVTNQLLFRVAEEAPSSLKELAHLNIFHPRFLKQEGDRLEEALSTAVPIEDHDLPRIEEMDPDQELLFKKLRKWRQGIATYRGIDTSVILSNRTLKEMIEKMPDSLESLESLDLMTPLKLRYYGNQLLSILRGEPVPPPPAELKKKG